MMRWPRQKKLNKPLCELCGDNQLPDEPALVQLKVDDGIAELQICDMCAVVFDKSAEVLKRGRK